jgi:hypothetical protein
MLPWANGGQLKARLRSRDTARGFVRHKRAVSSAEERLVYTQVAGDSNPSPPNFRAYGQYEPGISLRCQGV